MDVLAHALWAGAGACLARRRGLLSPKGSALTIGLAVLPDAPHEVPVLAWAMISETRAPVF